MIGVISLTSPFSCYPRKLPLLRFEIIPLGVKCLTFENICFKESGSLITALLTIPEKLI